MSFLRLCCLSPSIWTHQPGPILITPHTLVYFARILHNWSHTVFILFVAFFTWKSSSASSALFCFQMATFLPSSALLWWLLGSRIDVHLGCLQLLAVTNKADLGICILVFNGMYIVFICECLGRMVGPSGRCLLIFVRNHWSASLSSRIILYCQQQSTVVFAGGWYERLWNSDYSSRCVVVFHCDLTNDD